MTTDLTLQQATPMPQEVYYYSPTYKQKVGAYLRINTSISPVENSPSYNYGSVLDRTLRKNNKPSLCNPPDSTHGATADDRATRFDNKVTYKRNMRLSLFHLLMSRCQALQFIVNASERKSQTQRLTSDTHKNYSRILSFAQEAMKITEELESDALQARSEYWAGRGSGGLQDWQAAIIHFTNAIRLDASNDSLSHVASRYGGLLPREKEDVRFLLQNVTQRYNEWMMRTKEIQNRKHWSDIGDADWEDLKGPLWSPNRDFRTWVAKQQLEKNKETGRRTNVFLSKERQRVRKLWKHEIPMIRKRLAMFDEKAIFRRTLNADEWYYILRGDSITEDTSSAIYKDETEQEYSGYEKGDSKPSAFSPPLCSFKRFRFEESRNLGDELQQSGYLSDDETRPPSADSFGRMIRPDEEYPPPTPAP